MSAYEEPNDRDWFEQEPALGRTAWRTLRRLVRRASTSWLIWLSACVVASGGLGVWRARRPSIYSSTVLLRVTEGTVEEPSPELRNGELKTFVDSQVFTADNLLGLMQRHAAKFPQVDRDPVTALREFREHMDVGISGNDLVEDAPYQERQSARIAVSFEAVDRNVAWEVAQELASLIIDVSVKHQRRSLEQEQAGASAAAHGASVLRPHRLPTHVAGQADPGATDDGTLLRRELGPPPLPPPVVEPDPGPNGEGSLLQRAQKAEASADVGLRALEQGQLLLFSLVDAGHPALPENPVPAALMTFAIALAATATAVCLLVGGFDPRVVNEEDMSSIGMPILARFPVIPPGRGSR